MGSKKAVKKKTKRKRETRQRKQRARVEHPKTGYRTFEEWKYEVDRQFRLRTKCSWADLCGDEEPLQRAYDGGEKPQEFVVWWIEKYGLTDYSQESPYYG